MSPAQIEKRLKAVEDELARLKAEIKGAADSNTPKRGGWRAIVGSFTGDPLHAKAMKLARQYRQSQRPKPKKR
jgi:hypothetical protein